jgi:hypothetical protein
VIEEPLDYEATARNSDVSYFSPRALFVFARLASFPHRALPRRRKCTNDIEKLTFPRKLRERTPSALFTPTPLWAYGLLTLERICLEGRATCFSPSLSNNARRGSFVTRKKILFLKFDIDRVGD